MTSPALIAETPEEVGIDSVALNHLFERAEREVTEGRLEACQVAVARNGRLAAQRSFGQTPDGRAVDEDTCFAIFSCTKTITAAAIWKLLEQGDLSLEDHVSDLLPCFASHGKDKIQLLHLLNFTAGLASADAGPLTTGEGLQRTQSNQQIMGNSASRCEAFAHWKPDHAPGLRYAYHSESAHWVLVEIIQRITGCDHRDFIRNTLLDPMGLDTFFVGCPLHQQPHHRFADVVLHGQDATSQGYAHLAPLWNTSEMRALGNPAGGGFCHAGDLALFYQPLLHGGQVFDGPQIFRPPTIATATAVHTDDRHYELISEQPHVVLPTLRGLVVELAGDDTIELPPELAPGDGVHGMASAPTGITGRVPGKVLRGCFGYSNSSLAFGHNGAGGQAAWGDPQTGISFAFLTNTFSQPRKDRVTALATMANECALRPIEKGGRPDGVASGDSK